MPCTLQSLFSLSPEWMALGVAMLLLVVTASVGLVTLLTVSAIWLLVLSARVMMARLILVPILPLLAVATLEEVPLVLMLRSIWLFPVVLRVDVPA